MRVGIYNITQTSRDHPQQGGTPLHWRVNLTRSYGFGAKLEQAFLSSGKPLELLAILIANSGLNWQAGQVYTRLHILRIFPCGKILKIACWGSHPKPGLCCVISLPLIPFLTSGQVGPKSRIYSQRNNFCKVF